MNADSTREELAKPGTRPSCLLVVTDHTFHQGSDGVYDTFCFDQRFFSDYTVAFDEVRVVARMKNGHVPPHAHRSDGGGITFIPLPNVHGARWALAPSWVYLRDIRRLVATADAVCVRIPGMAGFAAARVATKLRKPLMSELIGDPAAAITADRARFGVLALPYAALMHRRTRWIVRRAALASYVSRAHLQARYPAREGVPTASISSIRLLDEDIRPPRTFAAPPRPLRLILVASLHPIKDHPTLLRGCQAAIGAGADLTLDLAGDGESLDTLRSMAQDLGLANRVTFHGHVAGRNRLMELLDQSDLFVMTSRNEGMPRAMIEAMSRGLPAIGSAAGGISELLPADQTFPPGDPGRLAELIVRAGRDTDLLDRLAVTSVAIAREFRDTVLSARRRDMLRRLHALSRGSR